MVEIKANGDGYAAVSDYLDKHYFNKFPKVENFGYDISDAWENGDVYYVGVECENAGFCFTPLCYSIVPATGEKVTVWLEDWWEGSETVKLYCFIPQADAEELLSRLDNVTPNGIETSVVLDEWIDFAERFPKPRR